MNRDDNWDGRKPATNVTHHPATTGQQQGPTRHMILIPHGQASHMDDFDEEDNNDDEDETDDVACLTAVGRQQAAQTGQQLAKFLAETPDSSRKLTIHLRVSDMARARETAQIVSKYLPKAKFQAADATMNEGRYVCGHVVT